MVDGVGDSSEKHLKWGLQKNGRGGGSSKHFVSISNQ